MVDQPGVRFAHKLEETKYLGLVTPGLSLAIGIGGFYVEEVWSYIVGALALIYFGCWVFANGTGLVVIALRNIRILRDENSRPPAP